MAIRHTLISYKEASRITRPTFEPLNVAECFHDVIPAETPPYDFYYDTEYIINHRGIIMVSRVKACGHVVTRHAFYGV